MVRPNIVGANLHEIINGYCIIQVDCNATALIVIRVFIMIHGSHNEETEYCSFPKKIAVVKCVATP